MNRNYNIDELKYLLADHITGQINEEDKKAVDKALNESEELRNLYHEMSSALLYVNDVKFEEPSPQYWNSLLPRIHQKIEERESKSFSWDSIALVWKILVPAAAILLIAVIYYLARPVDPGITKEEQKIEEIKKDSSREQMENKDKEITPGPKHDNTVKDERKVNDDEKKIKFRKYESGNIAKDEQPSDNVEEPLHAPQKEGFADLDIEETSIIASGEAAGFDEETENELKKLNDNERELLLQELEDINL